MGAVRYISHKDIDEKKWDACIAHSPQGLVYAYSWYLNIMSPEWAALVLEDYDVVMPLTGRRKWGIHYLYQPAFCAELGVFSKEEISADVVLSFLQQIPLRYQYIDICLNRSNRCEWDGHPFTLRRNYILPLKASYTEIYTHYSENHRRNLKKAVRNGLRFDDKIDIHIALALSRTKLEGISSYSDQDWKGLEQLFSKGLSQQAACCVGVRDRDDQLLSAALFFYSHNNWYYIVAGTTKEGKVMGASHFLVDQFICQHAGTETFLDFEGSDVDSVALFYKGFGAEDMSYPSLVVNRLPIWIRWMKA
jgi:hypothetical protein